MGYLKKIHNIETLKLISFIDLFERYSDSISSIQYDKSVHKTKKVVSILDTCI